MQGNHIKPTMFGIGSLNGDLMRGVKELFGQWSRCRDGTIFCQQLQQVLTPVRDRMNALLLRGYGTRVDGMCRGLYSHREWLWTFLDVEGIDPTNNAAERSLRGKDATALGLHPPSSVGGFVCFWRKLSFGTQSEQGSRFVETLLSVIETCRQQDKNVLTDVTAAVTAHFARKPAPSLLTGL